MSIEIEHADLSRSSSVRDMPLQFRDWLKEKRMTLAEWNRRQNLTRQHRHDDVRHKRQALAEIEIGSAARGLPRK